MADQQIYYGASSSLTCTLASLASDANLLAGRESTAVDNSSALNLDFLLSGKITTGTSPTDAKSISVYVYAAANDTPDYPDVLDGTDSDETMTSAGIRDSSLILVSSMPTDDTSDRAYWFAPVSIAAAVGSGTCPQRWGVFVVHDTGVALNSTGGNHVLSITPVYGTVS